MIYSSLRSACALFLGSSLVLSACGGGSDSVPAMYSVGGTIAGLASGASVVLQNDGATTSRSQQTAPLASRSKRPAVLVMP
ncbi:MAG: hypothetical protein QOF42_26 [Gammaproteobacteria bacterium]|nr:hypothetical protein [Gammaproteobacteria bacterium]